MKNWGEEIWNEKTKDHSDVGVILGTGYSVKKMNANTDNVVNIIATDFIKTLPENGKMFATPLNQKLTFLFNLRFKTK
jgi:hypothetical protein